MFSLALIPGLTSLRKASQSPRSIALVTTSYELRWSEVELLDAALRLDAHDTSSIAAKSHGIMNINRFMRGRYPFLEGADLIRVPVDGNVHRVNIVNRGFATDSKQVIDVRPARIRDGGRYFLGNSFLS